MDKAAVLLAIVRGETEPKAALGIGIWYAEDSLQTSGEYDSETLMASTKDVAKGLVSHRSSPSELRHWALIVLATLGSGLTIRDQDRFDGQLLERLIAGLGEALTPEGVGPSAIEAAAKILRSPAD